MLGVRYVIFRGTPPPQARPAFQSPDYWVLVNPRALPRAFVPRRVEVVADNRGRLERLASQEFNPREVGYVETPMDLPPVCLGSAEIAEEIPTRVVLSLQMQTAGLVVLADQWNGGWKAWLNGKEVPILRANHALRGVVVPAGTGKLEFRYQPGSFAWGLRLSGLAGITLLAWALLVFTASSEPAPGAKSPEIMERATRIEADSAA
jgi:hypothetical protein